MHKNSELLFPFKVWSFWFATTMYIDAIFAHFVSCKYINVCICNSLFVILRSTGRVYIYPLIDIIKWYREREKERMSTLDTVEYITYKTVLQERTRTRARVKVREKSISHISKKIFICNSIVRYCLKFSLNLVDSYDDVIRRGNNLVRSWPHRYSLHQN